MVFNSFEFILIFLPIAFFAFALTQRLLGWRIAYTVLGLASLVFYLQWSWELLSILMVSVVSNYVISDVLIRTRTSDKPVGLLLVFGIVGNLIALGYFKYSNFFIDIVNQVSGSGYSHVEVLLPIGISFYTFIQIGYLIEAYSGHAERQAFDKYVTFATFFPCVTAGPLVLQREIFAQMENREDSVFDFTRIASGLTMFTIGLFKKVILADSIAPYSNSAFDGVYSGQSIDIFAAWVGALAYTFQLYFDFSGYTDMALGLGAIFGILLPLNFNSPFKATSISDFWQRWHMTMTRFFTNFVYSPLAVKGMRHSLTQKYDPLAKYLVSGALPIVFTMFVAGIWHGSGWTFVLFGLLHGVAIAINNGWKQLNLPAVSPTIGWLLTMAVVVSGLVIFRAPDVATASTILSSMWGGTVLFGFGSTEFAAVAVYEALPLLVLMAAVVMLAPNSQEILSETWISSSPKPLEPGKHAFTFSWKPAQRWAFLTATIFVLSFSSIGSNSSFLYYQF